MNEHGTYNPKKQMCFNLSDYICTTLRKLKDLGIIDSYSEAVREMLYYALPDFIGIRTIIRLIGEHELKVIFQKPTDKPEIIKDNIDTLKKLFPDLPDYKFMNEE